VRHVQAKLDNQGRSLSLDCNDCLFHLVPFFALKQNSNDL
jgi:hypothetical protein